MYCFKVLKTMQRRHSSLTDNPPPERNRNQNQNLSSDSNTEDGVFNGLKQDPPSTQNLFSSLAGLQPGPITVQSGLVLGSSAGGGEVFIQMPPALREETSTHSESSPFTHHQHHHPHHRQQPQPPPHHQQHHFQHSHSRSSLLHAATSERHREESSDEHGTPAPALSELRAIVSWLQKGLPFILILLAKVCFQHKLGIAVCIGMASTFAYANSSVKHQVSLKEKRSVFAAIWIVVFLMANTLYLLYSIQSQQLQYSLIFLKPNLDNLDFFELMWIVGISDFVLKYITVSVKCLVLALPRIILAVKSKGKFYLLIEELSQLVRSLVPIQLWYKYIIGDDPSNTYFLGSILIILYSLCKSFDICGRIGGLRKAVKLLCHPQKYGVRASSQQCAEAGDMCAICQADFKDPLILICQHVFCEECLCLWFDRERTCPLCRSVAVETVRLWKDGSTSAHFQVY
ncbi:RING finger and transmembrane domain-containing protein 2 isoform X2 [Xenopus tropicalis]|uniref:RING finger and transmembrane domain-containing protein 2 isoform X2 n=1 Tax=Xenopus tropicalis TaxID=8364 RepID=A0A8J0QZ49_XENTR|nr:RING finger and transmembrane domain-containing protein 2 isoform X2 [Xenopus tropicalis]|eukprot:XP_004910560.1 PREDICTED: RING finger and transmembrane domain-containing protein 2 isoform X2 [Xenopus tropicalis]